MATTEPEIVRCGPHEGTARRVDGAHAALAESDEEPRAVRREGRAQGAGEVDLPGLRPREKTRGAGGGWPLQPTATINAAVAGA